MQWYEQREFDPFFASGKYIVAPLVIQKGFEDTFHYQLIDDGAMHVVDGGMIYPYEYFSHKSGFTGEIIENSCSYTIHHFNSAWLNKSSASIRFRSGVHQRLIWVLGSQEKIAPNKLNELGR